MTNEKSSHRTSGTVAVEVIIIVTLLIGGVLIVGSINVDIRNKAYNASIEKSFNVTTPGANPR